MFYVRASLPQTWIFARGSPDLLRRKDARDDPSGDRRRGAAALFCPLACDRIKIAAGLPPVPAPFQSSTKDKERFEQQVSYEAYLHKGSASHHLYPLHALFAHLEVNRIACRPV
jgi:hypothetical protein